LALAAWLVVAGTLLASLVAGLFSIRRILSGSRAVNSTEWLQALNDACARLQLTVPPRLVLSDRVDMAFTCDVLRPTIVLPRGSEEWSHDRRRAVLLHEVGHVRRRDLVGHAAAGVACALYWFNPLVWLAARRLRIESELACDDLVLDTGVRASEYAQHLLELVTALTRRPSVPAGALAIASAKDFEGRLIAILDRPRGRASTGRTHRAALLGVAVPLTLSIAAVVPSPRSDRGGSVPRAATIATGTVPVTMPVAAPVAVPVAATVTASVTVPVAGPSIEAPVSPAAAAKPPETGATPAPLAAMVAVDQRAPEVPAGTAEPEDVFAPCAAAATNHHNSDTDGSGSGRTWTSSGAVGGCRFDVNAEGDIRFNRDATAIESIAAGGTFDATANIHGDVTRLVVRASAAGDVSYEFTRNGQPNDSRAAANAWLGQFLLGLDRTTAFAIDTRLPLLLRNSGPEGVLAEVDRMHSDYARGTYLMRLLGTATLDANAVRHTGAIVATMAPDHQAGEAVIAVANTYSLADAATRKPFFDTALALHEDHERAEALLSILARATLGDRETLAAIDAARATRVDHEKAQILTAVAKTQRLSADGERAFTAAAQGIGEDWQRARVLALPRRGGSRGDGRGSATEG
ncbi:MAG TPA: M56 family metallopeptidase, partial [Gemmatimonadaceae bacterium]|nr:M56 family metallopeptidase [Gemmatimonadaceae bacterium]